MDTKHNNLMTKKVGNHGNKYDFHNRQQTNTFIKSNQKSMRTSMIQAVHNPMNQSSQFPKYSHKKHLTNQQFKPYKAKNVGSNVFMNEYYSDSIYIAKPFSKIESQKSLEKSKRNLSSCSTVPSEEELTQSSLHGFKVVQNGKVVHNEAVNEHHYDVKGVSEKLIKSKFSASIYSIEPNSKEIFIPSFIDDDEDN